jgi:hypothetical protein
MSSARRFSTTRPMSRGVAQPSEETVGVAAAAGAAEEEAAEALRVKESAEATAAAAAEEEEAEAAAAAALVSNASTWVADGRLPRCSGTS